jgi:hypothetical protein
MTSGAEPQARLLDGNDTCHLVQTGEAVRVTAPLPVSRIKLPLPGEDWPEGTHFVEMPDIREARRLLGPIDETMRRRRSEVHFSALPHVGRTRLLIGKHDRGEEYMFADGQICAADAAGHDYHFPARLKVVRQRSHRIRRGETFDVSVSHTAWPGVDYREELYVLVRIDRLIVEPGSSLEVHGNILVLDCGEIEMRRTAGTSASAEDIFEIRIMPTWHPAYSSVRFAPAIAGRSGAHGANGADGSPSMIVGTPFGPLLKRRGDEKAGIQGSDGEDGGDGGNGQNGGITMMTDIRIGALSGFAPASLRVLAQAGAGRPGGAGGNGGDGGAGGNGADGLDGVGGHVSGGRGARGGHGGNGGNGGRGGNGGLGSNIFIQVRTSDAGCLDLRSLDSVGGPGGLCGKPGNGGAGGVHGTLAAGAPEESRAEAGVGGREGKAGPPGKARAGPRMHVFTTP